MVRKPVSNGFSLIRMTIALNNYKNIEKIEIHTAITGSNIISQVIGHSKLEGSPIDVPRDGLKHITKSIRMEKTIYIVTSVLILTCKVRCNITSNPPTLQFRAKIKWQEAKTRKNPKKILKRTAGPNNRSLPIFSLAGKRTERKSEHIFKSQ